MKWLVFVIFLIFQIVGKCQPLLSFQDKIYLENFYANNLILYSSNIKICNNLKDKIYVIGTDTLLENIHILTKNINSGIVKNLYLSLPFKNSIKSFEITSANVIDSSLIFIVFDKRYLIYIKNINDELTLIKSSELNSFHCRPFHYYYFSGESLYGIYPISNLNINNSCYFLNDSFAVYNVIENQNELIYYSDYFNNPFWHLGFSSYSIGYQNYLFLANALKNEIISIDLTEKKVSTIRNPIIDFVNINVKFYDSIKKTHPRVQFDLALSKIMRKDKFYNYIFKIIPRNRNEIWLIWRGGLPYPYQIKLDIIKYDSISKQWINSGHDINYATTESIKSNQNYPINPFFNLTNIFNNKLFCLSYDNIDFVPIGKTFQEVESEVDKYPKSLKLLEYKILE